MEGGVWRFARAHCQCCARRRNTARELNVDARNLWPIVHARLLPQGRQSDDDCVRIRGADMRNLSAIQIWTGRTRTPSRLATRSAAELRSNRLAHLPLRAAQHVNVIERLARRRRCDAEQRSFWLRALLRRSVRKSALVSTSVVVCWLLNNCFAIVRSRTSRHWVWVERCHTLETAGDG